MFHGILLDERGLAIKTVLLRDRSQAHKYIPLCLLTQYGPAECQVITAVCFLCLVAPIWSVRLTWGVHCLGMPAAGLV
jgi:hypothetical protein